MGALHLLAWFAGGAFAFNAVPHLVSGLQGRPFQTPFARPPGIGLSPPLVNVAWAFLNVAAAWLLILRIGDFDPRSAADAASVGAGGLLAAFGVAFHFGRLHGDEGSLPPD